MQTVSYDGSSFQGFQYQTPKVRTVQGELEKAAARVLLPAGRVVGASRTDAGAHATGQIAHLDVTGSPDSIQSDSLMMYLNGVLPDDVKVQQVEVAPQGDHHLNIQGLTQLMEDALILVAVAGFQPPFGTLVMATATAKQCTSLIPTDTAMFVHPLARECPCSATSWCQYGQVLSSYQCTAYVLQALTAITAL